MSKSIPEIQIPESKDKIMRQINALETMIKEDTNDHDRHIHETALNDLQQALKQSQISESIEAKIIDIENDHQTDDWEHEA
ncbi:MAG: hypothetical protein NHB14_15800 [Desulfosporosinus sp.]|nr:hypothetical protein [Desulfosporosinus sp.]